ncbi:DUF6578 domain-containing protein [Streptomyces sp. NPDC048650]|uniref:DUF6578 domain-containing protein n=1 Tax=unclassified Streptomyces TaxID=2593676 RepID=UPI0037116809
MDLTVWMESWQMECCGEPFRIGSQISWSLLDADEQWLADVIGAEAAARVDAAENHHGGWMDDSVEQSATTGTVAAIAAVHCRYAPRPGASPHTHRPVPGSGTLTPLTAAERRTPDHGELEFTGFLVELNDVRR